jgi:CheY-like chemotaxis protein
MNDGLTILIADDNEDLLETFAMILRRRGFFVETAENGLAAVDKYKKHRFDVALMDIVMPEMDGVEAFRRIKEMDPNAAIILMTGYSDEAQLKLARDKGARYIIYKPIKIEQLIEVITEAGSEPPVLLIDEEGDIDDSFEEADIVTLIDKK